MAKGERTKGAPRWKERVKHESPEPFFIVCRSLVRWARTGRWVLKMKTKCRLRDTRNEAVIMAGNCACTGGIAGAPMCGGDLICLSQRPDSPWCHLWARRGVPPPGGSAAWGAPRAPCRVLRYTTITACTARGDTQRATLTLVVRLHSSCVRVVGLDAPTTPHPPPPLLKLDGPRLAAG